MGWHNIVCGVFCVDDLGLFWRWVVDVVVWLLISRWVVDCCDTVLLCCGFGLLVVGDLPKWLRVWLICRPGWFMV